MNRKFKLTILTLAVAGTLCACSNTTSDASPTPDSSPSMPPENRSGIVGYGYNGSTGSNGYTGYNGYGDYSANPDGGMWNATSDAARNAGNAIGRAAGDVGNAARDAANDVRQGINDMARDADRITNTAW